jgi:tetratricopeptide (TPR) repeat protein/transcriptional regulator with XRE-family HTH domain
MGVIAGPLGGPRGLVRVRRLGAGLTQEQLAEMTGLSVRAISDIECGRTTRPRRSSVALLDAALIRSGAEGLEPGPGGGPAAGSRADRSSVPAVPRQLPQTARGFAGRERELSALTEIVREPETAGGTGVMCAIAGTAGVGKTALALCWAHRAIDEFPDGQLFVNLRGYDPDRPVPAADALAGFLRSLGVPGRRIPPGIDERAALYRSLLAGRRMLVVLDNAGSAEQIRPLLPAAPGCVTVMTSRDALAGLVARDGAARLDVGLLPLADAVGLLRALVGARAEADPHAAETLAALCSRLPLALRVAAELAAMRPAMPLAELCAELADEHQRLDLLDADGDPRAGVRAVLSWSYRLLDPGAARAFRLLGLHPGLDLDHYSVAALAAITPEQAGHVLDQLARAHLIEASAPGRAAMHDLLRGYARRLAAAEDSESEQRAALTGLFDYYLHTAAAAMDALFPAERHRRPRVGAPASPSPASTAPPVAGPAGARAWLDAERPALAAAIAHMAAHGWRTHAIRLAATLFRYLEVGGHYPELRTIHGHARRAAQDADDRPAEIRALHELAVLDLHQGRYQEVIDQMTYALELCREAGDQTGQAGALANLGIACIQQGRYRPAAANLRQAVALYRQAGDQFGEGRAMNNLGLIELHQGRYQQATRRLERALALHRQVGDQANETNCLTNLGLVHLRRGQYQQAADRLEQSLVLSREIGKPISEAYSLTNLGILDLRQGRYQPAARRLRQALALSREHNERSSEAEALNGLGEVLLATGRPGNARARHAAALDLAIQIGETYEQARALGGLAATYHAAGDAGRALSHWQESLTLFTRLGSAEADQIRSQMTAAGLSGSATT